MVISDILVPKIFLVLILIIMGLVVIIKMVRLWFVVSFDKCIFLCVMYCMIVVFQVHIKVQVTDH